MSRLLHSDVFRRLSRTRDRMHARPEERHRLEDLAREAGISRFHYLRLFREAFGATPKQYLTEVRVARAKRLLVREEMSVTEVCFDVGFSSLGSFSTMFAERAGAPPSAWRRRFWQVSANLDSPASLVVPWCFFAAYRPGEPD